MFTTVNLDEDNSGDLTDNEKKFQNIEKDDDESPIEEVRLTVSNSDDPTLPVWTFRMWFLGFTFCILLTLVNTFFSYRSAPLVISMATVQIATMPIGMFMAKVLPTTKFRIPGCGEREFSLNPGPFNIKEHVLISIFANCGGSTYGTHIVTSIKAYYHRSISIYSAWILVITTQVIGYGFAGVFRSYVVDPPEMWWPGSMVQVSVFRAFHEKDEASYRSSRLKFFVIILICSFVWYIVPGYLFTTITSISFLCYLYPNSVLAHQIGSGKKGLGVLSFTFDWATVVSFLGSPLVSPFFTIVNVIVGYLIIVYALLPLAYWWLNIYNSQNYPLISYQLYNSAGRIYDVESIVNKNFEIDMPAYNKQGRLNISVYFAMAYGLNFASTVATIVHVALFYGKDTYRQFKGSAPRSTDIHNRLMSKYKRVPDWWFHLTLFLSFGLALAMCLFMNKDVQFPWWGLVLSILVGFVFTLPISLLVATTNQSIGLNVITEYIFGYLYPGRPIANVCFKTYGSVTVAQAKSFLFDFKVAHYMKIPPKSMFLVQLIGTLIGGTGNLLVAWWLLTNIENICQEELLPPNSPWTCPNERVFYDASVIWGLVGPERMFGRLGNYSSLNYFFLIGGVLPVISWLLQRAYPTKSWITLINFPVMLSATAWIPPAATINFNSWIVLGVIFQFFIFRYRKLWWEKYNYVLSGALDAGVGFMGIFIYFAFTARKINLDWWGNQGEHCSLGSCPYNKGIHAYGCPIK